MEDNILTSIAPPTITFTTRPHPRPHPPSTSNPIPAFSSLSLSLTTTSPNPNPQPTFQPFPRLPVELRLKTWLFSFLPRKITISPTTKHPGYPLPSAFRVNRESRFCAKECYEPFAEHWNPHLPPIMVSLGRDQLWFEGELRGYWRNWVRYYVGFENREKKRLRDIESVGFVVEREERGWEGEGRGWTSGEGEVVENVRWVLEYLGWEFPQVKRVEFCVVSGEEGREWEVGVEGVVSEFEEAWVKEKIEDGEE